MPAGGTQSARPGRHEVVLLRHGETEWSRTGRHTGRTDVPLTERGRAQAATVEQRLAGHRFAVVHTSPLSRARDTCALAGFGARATLDDNLLEWDYGSLEGRTTAEIRVELPDWLVFDGPVPGGESLEDVVRRVDAALAAVAEADGDALLVAHGHVLRVLAARWLGLDGAEGRLLALDPASVSVLGWEHDNHVLRRWNDTAHLGEHID
ncbi:MAG: histidine phosphatase family protein [Acidimicrobiia bacterium]|nr:histidine phosphatase family protein [Acidimicrobiia bacterium]